MINTNCEKCIFAKIDEKDCVFSIPEIIKDYKDIVKNNDYNLIQNYKCRYTLSDDVYQQLIANGYDIQQIIKFIIDNLKIKYYLVVDIDPNKDDVKKLCHKINGLDIKPQFISFINKNLDIGNDLSDIIQSTLDISIKWKLHNFLEDIDLQGCMTICMDTNFSKTPSQIFIVYDDKKNKDSSNILNDRVNFLHMHLIVYQTHCHAIVDDISSLDGLAMSFHAYKILINNCDPNILLAIQKEKNTESKFNYINYDYDTK